jgi:putative ABC transport system permease protein
MALPIRYNIRNLRQRWKVTLLAIFGIALVVAAVVVIASMGAGFQAALRATGTDNNAIVTQRGSLSELSSWISIANAQTIMTDPRIARDSSGTPLAS